MNLYRLKEKDEVRVPRREGREKYTKLEERKMWFFFARELRAGNQDALFKRRILWKLFEQEEDTNRKMDGLESHFRKQMLKYMHRSNMSKEDMFLCLRFFRIGLNPKQQKFLEERYGCEVVCTFDGTFRRANFSFDGNNFSLPTDEELATIMADEMMMMEEGSLLEEIDQPNDDGMDFLNFDNPLEEGTSRNSENSNNNNNRRQNERSETSIVAENLNNNDDDDDENGSSSQHSREILNNYPRIDENEQFQQIARRQSNAEIIQLEMVPANSNNLDCSSELIGSTSSARAFQRQNEENLRIEANLNLTNQSQQSTSQQGRIHLQMNPAKKAFINDVLKVLDGNMSTRTFIEQGGGSAVPECAEAINWLVGDENDDESIPIWRR